MRINRVNFNTNLYKNISHQKREQKAQTFTRLCGYNILSVNGKENIVAKTEKAPKGFIINSDIIDTFLRDKKGGINEDYLRIFCKTYDEMIKKGERRNFALKDFYGGALENIIQRKQNISSIGVKGNIYSIDAEKQREEEKLKLDELEQICKLELDFEAQRPKNPNEDALKKTIIFMQMCKKDDGYNYYSNYGNKISMASTLFELSEDYRRDIATPLIEYSRIKPNESSNMELLSMLELFYGGAYNFENIEPISRFLIQVSKNKDNHTWSIVYKMCDLTKEVSASDDDFVFFINQCVNKNDNKFNFETMDSIINMHKELNSHINPIKAEYEPNYVNQYRKNTQRIVKEYLLKYNNQETGTMRPNAINPNTYCQQILNN